MPGRSSGRMASPKARGRRRKAAPKRTTVYSPAQVPPLPVAGGAPNYIFAERTYQLEEGEWRPPVAERQQAPEGERPFRISVVIPSYNEERHIAEALTHLRRIQPGLEIILGDGHSADRTAEMARPFVDKIVFETKRSIGAGRNVGAKAATGDIIVFNDADTRVPKEFFDRLQSVFKDPKVVGMGCRILPEEPTWFQEWMFNIFNLMIWFSVFIRKPMLSGPVCAYRKDAFYAVGGFDEEMKASEDQDLCLRIGKLGKVVYYHDIIAYSSKRRLLKMGWLGLFKDWGRTTADYLLGRKTKYYELVRDVG